MFAKALLAAAVLAVIAATPAQACAFCCTSCGIGNGISLNGMGLNSPFLQGAKLNGIRANGPVIQGAKFNDVMLGDALQEAGARVIAIEF